MLKTLRGPVILAEFKLELNVNAPDIKWLAFNRSTELLIFLFHRTAMMLSYC